MHWACGTGSIGWWSHWLREAGVDAPDRMPRRGVRLDSQAHEGHAAMAGQGRLIAADTIRSRLARLEPRAERAGATFIDTKDLLDASNAIARTVPDLTISVSFPHEQNGSVRRPVNAPRYQY